METTPRLSARARTGILLGLLALCMGVLLGLDPIPQDPAYHRFADSRGFLGIPNFNDVTSSAGFALAGLLAIATLEGESGRQIFFAPSDRRPYLVFFAAVALVALGSAYYHWAPTNDRLLWDRLPMSIAFMGLAAAVVADRIDAKAGSTWLLAVLVALGTASVLYWAYTEQQGRGDLRCYAFVQFFPLIALPWLLWLFPEHRYLPGRTLAWVLVWYGLSKVLEHLDAEIFAFLGGALSGHTLKHLAAAASALVLLQGLRSGRKRRPEAQAGSLRSPP